MPYVVGALGSRPTRSKGIGRGGDGGREPKGRRHAVDLDSRQVACGTRDSLRVFEDWPWVPDGECCASCEAVAPFSDD